MAISPRCYRLIATFFGAGNAPFMPGTAGTIAAIPLYYLLRRLTLFWYICFLILLTGIGIIASHKVEQEWGEKDPSRIVIDEVCGFLVALILRPRGFKDIFIAIVLFRFFDILKPPPVGTIDKHVPGGLGIMADDLAAGAITACIVPLIKYMRS